VEFAVHKPSYRCFLFEFACSSQFSVFHAALAKSYQCDCDCHLHRRHRLCVRRSLARSPACLPARLPACLLAKGYSATTLASFRTGSGSCRTTGDIGACSRQLLARITVVCGVPNLPACPPACLPFVVVVIVVFVVVFVFVFVFVVVVVVGWYNDRHRISIRLSLSSSSSSSSLSSSSSDNHVDAEISFVQGDVELWVYRIQSWVSRSEFGMHAVQGKLN